MENKKTLRPVQHRATISDDIYGVLITIPSQKSILLLLIFLVWLPAWIFFGNLASQDPDMEALLLFMIVGGIFAGSLILLMILRSFFGKESIRITDSGITISKTICGIGPKKEYSGHRIENWRVRDIDKLKKPEDILNINLLNNGCIGFDYGIKAIYFGNDLDEAEAQFIKDLCVHKTSQAGSFQNNHVEDPDRGRVIIFRTGVSTKVSIPAKGLYFTYAILALMIAISIMGIIHPPIELEFLDTPKFKLSLVIILVLGVYGAVYTIIHFRTRSSLRKDILYLNYDSLVVSRSILGIRKNETYEWPRITNWRIKERKQAGKGESIYMLTILSGWEVAFDYEEKTVSIGVGLRKNEAEYIMNLCKKRGGPFYQ